MFLSDIFSRSAGAKLVFGGLILCLSALAGDNVKTDKPKAPPRASKAKATAQQGMTISRDPDSGQLQSGALDLTPPPSSVTVGEQPQPVQLPNGLVMVPASDDHMSTALVSRSADGTLVYQCVDGKAKAEQALKKLEQDTRKIPATRKEKASER